MNNITLADRIDANKIVGYNDLIERIENLEKQYEIKKKKELVRVF